MSLGRIRSLNVSQDLAVAELDHSFEFPLAAEVATVYVHSSVPITEIVTVSLDSGVGPEYDTVMEARQLSEEQDFVYGAGGTLTLNEGDRLRVQVTNANAIGTVYVTAKGKVN